MYPQAHIPSLLPGHLSFGGCEGCLGRSKKTESTASNSECGDPITSNTGPEEEKFER